MKWEPLNFSDSSSIISSFVAFENLEHKGIFLQRGLDVSYLPNSLRKDGKAGGQVEDYWGVVAKVALRWPARDDGIRLRVSSEVGYAPDTQTNASENIDENGDADGFAWNFTDRKSVV